MVFSKLFGGGRKDSAEKRAPEGAGLLDFFDSLEPALGNAARMIQANRTIDRGLKRSFYDHLYRGQFDEARAMIRTHFLPAFSESAQAQLIGGGSASGWATLDQLTNERIIWGNEPDRPVDGMSLAFWWRTADSGRDVVFHGEGHLLTVAPTGAGKGQHFILPKLLDYQGPAVILDPKCENFRETAWRRNLFGPVFKWAPFEADSDCYNPLDFVKDWDDARVLADLMVVTSGRDAFWDTAARNLLTGLIMFVIGHRPPEKRTVREVCRVLASGAEAWEHVVHELQESGDDNLIDLGNRIDQLRQNDRLRESIYESLNSQLDVWRSKAIVATTSATTPGLSMERIVAADYMVAQMAAVNGVDPGWTSPAPGVLNRGAAASIYIVIPPDKIGSYRSVLRVLLGQMLKSAMRAYDETRRFAEENPDDDLPADFPWWPMLFLFDEFPQLGYMAPIEEAISTSRSYNVRLWLFAQNLSQLSRVYDNWQTIVSGCKAQIYFRPNDMETASFISERIGKRKDVWGGEDWLASPQALMGADFKKDCVIVVPNVSPIRAELYDALHENGPLKRQIAEWKETFGTTIDRAPKPEAAPSPDGGDVIPDDAVKPPPTAGDDDGDSDAFDGDEEYQKEIAEAKRRAEERRRARDESTPKPPSFDE